MYKIVSILNAFKVIFSGFFLLAGQLPQYKTYWGILNNETCKNKYFCLLTTDLKYFKLSRNITTIFVKVLYGSHILGLHYLKCSFCGSFIGGGGGDDNVKLTWLSSQMKNTARKAIQELDSWTTVSKSIDV